MLRDYGLTYLIKDEVLLITTPEKADEELITQGLSGSRPGAADPAAAAAAWAAWAAAWAGMGGMGGGMGGGMMGGMGGGMGGMGGGMGAAAACGTFFRPTSNDCSPSSLTSRPGVSKPSLLSTI